MNTSVNVDEFSEVELVRFGKRLYNNYSLSRKVHEKRSNPTEVYDPLGDWTCLFRAMLFHIDKGRIYPAMVHDPLASYVDPNEPVEITFKWDNL